MQKWKHGIPPLSDAKFNATVNVRLKAQPYYTMFSFRYSASLLRTCVHFALAQRVVPAAEYCLALRYLRCMPMTRIYSTAYMNIQGGP
jgi:hypothetical protein